MTLPEENKTGEAGGDVWFRVRNRFADKTSSQPLSCAWHPSSSRSSVGDCDFVPRGRLLGGCFARLGCEESMILLSPPSSLVDDPRAGTRPTWSGEATPRLDAPAVICTGDVVLTCFRPPDSSSASVFGLPMCAEDARA